MRFSPFALLVTIATLLPRPASALPEPLDLFTAGQGGYHTYRIPALLVTTKGTVLVFAEGRKQGAGDAGDIDLVLRRSTDAGRTFSPTQIIWDDAANTCGNPAPVLDRKTGTIWLLMTHNPGTAREKDITAAKPGATRTVWVTHSTDDGLTWAKPVDITAAVKKPDWTWYATGPGAGIQSAAGRLIIPCDHKRPGDHGYAHVIYSDDAGQTWQLGGSAGPNTNESRVVELPGGTLLLNMRNYGIKDAATRGRAIATSTDAGLTWSAVSHDPTLVEPVCQAALIPGPLENRPTYLFSNPASPKRERMTLRLSRDDCKTWPDVLTLHPGPAAYSDLALLPDNTILCLYECGAKSPYERITLARIRSESLLP